VNVVLQKEDHAKQVERNSKLDELFESWDNDSSGFVDVDFIECTMSKYKPTPLADAIARGK